MTIDINELRRLAQAATPHVGHACKYQDAHWLREGHVDFENADLFIASERPQEDAAFYAASNPAAVIELLDRLEAAEKERDECNRRRLEAADHFAAQTALMKKKYDALRAKVEAMEKQEPVGWVDGGELRALSNGNSVWLNPDDQGRMVPVYLAHGAQEAKP